MMTETIKSVIINIWKGPRCNRSATKMLYSPFLLLRHWTSETWLMQFGCYPVFTAVKTGEHLGYATGFSLYTLLRAATVYSTRESNEHSQVPGTTRLIQVDTILSFTHWCRLLSVMSSGFNNAGRCLLVWRVITGWMRFCDRSKESFPLSYLHAGWQTVIWLISIISWHEILDLASKSAVLCWETELEWEQILEISI